MNRIERISKLYEAGTPGPWRVEQDKHRGYITSDARDIAWTSAQTGLVPANETLIVALHEAWPAMKAFLEAADELYAFCNGYSPEHIKGTGLVNYLFEYSIARDKLRAEESKA